MSSRRLGPNDLVFCSAMQMKVPLRDKVEAAARAGYAGISITVLDHASARSSGMSDADIRSLYADHGLVPCEFEALTQWLSEYTAGPVTPGSRRAEERNVLAAAEAIGCPSVTAVHLGEGEVSIETAAEAFAELCDHAGEHGLDACLEFLPWTGIPDLATARSIIESAGRPNGRIVVDSWHLHRSGTPVEALARLPAELIGCIQLSDAAVEPGKMLIDETMHSRLVPGEGVIDLANIVRALDAAGNTKPLGVEVISDRLNGLPASDVAAMTLAAMRDIVVRARG
jgi:sugar phosphate isomerase/epimerase